MSTAADLLKSFVQAERQDAREAVNYIHVLAQQEQNNINNEHARRTGRVLDAFWKSRCPEYVSDEESDQMPNVSMVNCNFNSDETIKQIGDLIRDVSDEENAVDQKKTDKPAKPEPVEPARPANGKQPSTLAKAALIGASLFGAGGAGALLTQWLSPGNTIDPSIYSVEAIPYEPAAATQ